MPLQRIYGRFDSAQILIAWLHHLYIEFFSLSNLSVASLGDLFTMAAIEIGAFICLFCDYFASKFSVSSKNDYRVRFFF